MKISVCIPSYKRPFVKTLSYLPFCKVYVSEDEYDDYIKQNKGFEKNIIKAPKEKQGNTSRIRNYILDEEFKNNDICLLLDDDIKGIYRFKPNGMFGYERELVRSDEFFEFLEKYSLLCDEFGFKLWGLGLNSDCWRFDYFRPFNTVGFLGGPFQCHLKNDIRYDERLSLKEDYDVSIQHCNKYRGILRLQGYFYECNQANLAGGCAALRNRVKEQEQMNLLRKKWGSKIVQKDNVKRAKKQKKYEDINPIIKIPIKGV